MNFKERNRRAKKSLTQSGDSCMQGTSLEKLLTDWRSTERRLALLAESYGQAPLGEDGPLRLEIDELANHRDAVLTAIYEHPISCPQDAASKLEAASYWCRNEKRPVVDSIIAYLRKGSGAGLVAAVFCQLIINVL